MGKIISFFSASGGVGKSTAVALTALELAPKNDNKVLILDAGFGLCDSESIIGCDGETTYDLGDIAAGRCEPSDAADKCSGFLVIPPPSDGSSVRPEEVMRIAAKLREKCRFVLIDCPVSCRNDCSLYAGESDISVICTSADERSLEKAARLRLGLPRKKGSVRLLLTKYDTAALRKGDIKNIDECIDKVSAQLIAVFPVGEGRQRQAARNLACRLSGEAVPLMKL